MDGHGEGISNVHTIATTLKFVEDLTSGLEGEGGEGLVRHLFGGCCWTKKKKKILSKKWPYKKREKKKKRWREKKKSLLENFFSIYMVILGNERRKKWSSGAFVPKGNHGFI